MNRAPAKLVAWIHSGDWIDLVTRFAMALAIVVAAMVAARLAARLLRGVRSRSEAGAPLIYIVEKLAAYVLVLAGIVAGLSALGVNLTSLTVFAGAVGVGVGLGLQGIVRDFVAGLVVIFDPLVGVGDFIELENGIRGEIIEVGPRATRLRTNDGLNVVLPNSKLVDHQVINWTLKGSSRRIHVPFGVAYGVDKALVREAVLEAVRKVPFTQPDSDTRKAQVWLTGFGDSALNFELVVWPTVDAVRRPAAMRAAYTWAIEDALRGAGIEIPYPQMSVRVRSLFGREGDEALGALGLSGGPPPPGRPAGPASSRNDAAEDLVADAEQEARERAAQERAARET